MVSKKYLMTTREAAEYLGVSEFMLKAARMKMPPFIRMGGKVFYEVGDLVKWKAKKTAVKKVTK